MSPLPTTSHKPNGSGLPKHMACLRNEIGEVWNEEMGTGEEGHGKEKFIDYVMV